MLCENSDWLHPVDKLSTGLEVRKGDPDLKNRFRCNLVAVIDGAAAEEDVLVDVLHEKFREEFPFAVYESLDTFLDPFLKPILVLVDDVRHGIRMGYTK